MAKKTNVDEEYIMNTQEIFEAVCNKSKSCKRCPILKIRMKDWMFEGRPTCVDVSQSKEFAEWVAVLANRRYWQ
jgi:hypothetical protein